MEKTVKLAFFRLKFRNCQVVYITSMIMPSCLSTQFIYMIFHKIS